ncbi:MAG TPA: hypothetical protein VKP65_12365 [Rhodothermales bacterium]|nr:hypothetical protein [Rhodothermales bacterium]
MKKQLVCLIVALCLWGCQSQEQAEPEGTRSDATVEETVPQVSHGDFTAAGLETGEVETFFASLEQAIASDNRRKVASLIAYPLTVDLAEEPLTLRDEGDFVRAYEAIVTDAVKQVVADAEVATLFANWQGVRIGQGEVWFSGVYEEDDVEEQEYVLKITAINPVVSEGEEEIP